MVGPSGCGKTTFLRMLLGEESPTRGTIELDGKPLVAEPGPDRGVVFQRYSVFPHLTVLQNVIIGREFERSRFLGKLFGAKRRAAEEEAEEVLKEVGLSAHRAKYPRRAVGRHAAAARHLAGTDPQAEGAAAGRAVRRTRCRHQEPDVRIDPASLGGAQDEHLHGHP